MLPIDHERPIVATEITVRDTETGETQTRTIENDHILICAGSHYVHYKQFFTKSQTTQYTVKVQAPDGAPE